MHYLRRFLDPGGRLLARHLHRLCDDLSDLADRIREGIASAAGNAVAGVIREIVKVLLNHPSQPIVYPFQESRQVPPIWPTREYSPDDGYWRNDSGQMPGPEEDWYGESKSQDNGPSPGGKSWWPSLAVVVHVLLHSLQSRIGQYSAWAAIGCAVITTLITTTLSLSSLPA